MFGPRATLHNFGAKFFSVDLGTSQYLYNDNLRGKKLKQSLCIYLSEHKNDDLVSFETDNKLLSVISLFGVFYSMITLSLISNLMLLFSNSNECLLKFDSELVK